MRIRRVQSWVAIVLAALALAVLSGPTVLAQEEPRLCSEVTAEDPLYRGEVCKVENSVTGLVSVSAPLHTDNWKWGTGDDGGDWAHECFKPLPVYRFKLSLDGENMQRQLLAYASGSFDYYVHALTHDEEKPSNHATCWEGGDPGYWESTDDVSLKPRNHGDVDVRPASNISFAGTTRPVWKPVITAGISPGSVVEGDSINLWVYGTLPDGGGARSEIVGVKYRLTRPNGAVITGKANIGKNKAWVSWNIGTYDDSVENADRKIKFEILAGDGYSLGGPSVVEATVKDNDPWKPDVSVSSLSEVITEGDSVWLKIFATRPTGDGDRPEDIAVKFKVTHPDGEYSSTKPIPRNAWHNEFSHTVTDDDKPEDDSELTLTVLPGDGYNVGTPSTVTVIVKDDENHEFLLKNGDDYVREVTLDPGEHFDYVVSVRVPADSSRTTRYTTVKLDGSGVALNCGSSMGATVPSGWQGTATVGKPSCYNTQGDGQGQKELQFPTGTSDVWDNQHGTSWHNVYAYGTQGVRIIHEADAPAGTVNVTHTNGATIVVTLTGAEPPPPPPPTPTPTTITDGPLADRIRSALASGETMHDYQDRHKSALVAVTGESQTCSTGQCAAMTWSQAYGIYISVKYQKWSGWSEQLWKDILDELEG